ncbi:putative cyclin-D7-1 [Benincasa hispida]|uniref:putative cyclin-D7-1 n=1 Tax=Benincasa hispida TaxID=102211 RepID=UPI00190065CB|nr:putative cyclin-D7-1 [Benincasa hispida]
MSLLKYLEKKRYLTSSFELSIDFYYSFFFFLPNMEALLCDEDWLSCSTETRNEKHGGYGKSVMGSVCMTTTMKEEDEQAVSVCMEKEMSYMPEPHYKEFLESKSLVFVRLRCIQWLIKCRSRWNFSYGTVFLAANYLDRFISKNRSKEWKDWMVELLAVACLSIASKFHETYPPTLSEIQMEDYMDHVFDQSCIERMEMILLEALDWHLSCPTPYYYIQLLGLKLLESSIGEEADYVLMVKIKELLIGAVLDYRLIPFKPSLIAISSIWCCLDLLPPITSQSSLSYFMSLFDQHHKDEMMKCRAIMEAVQSSCCPQSPTSVLMKNHCC